MKRHSLIFTVLLLVLTLTAGIVFADSGGGHEDITQIVSCDNSDYIAASVIFENQSYEYQNFDYHSQSMDIEEVLYYDAGGGLTATSNFMEYYNDFTFKSLSYSLKPDCHLRL